VQLKAARARLVTRPQRRPVGEPPDQVPHRTFLVPHPIDHRTSSPGIRVATTIVLLEVSIPRWIAPAGDVRLDMTAGSFPPSRVSVLGDCTFQTPPTHDISQQAYGQSPEPAAS
jgi:hypothetical protein